MRMVAGAEAAPRRDWLKSVIAGLLVQLKDARRRGLFVLRGGVWQGPSRRTPSQLRPGTRECPAVRSIRPAGLRGLHAAPMRLCCHSMPDGYLALPAVGYLARVSHAHHCLVLGGMSLRLRCEDNVRARA